MANQFPFTLTYQKRGTQPPIFVAGTFTDPPWVPQEMQHSIGGDGEITFSKTGVLEAEEDVQYKFRVGTGDWWVLDETAPTAMDVHGNLNNVMRVPPSASDRRHSPTTENDAGGRRPLTPTTSNTSEGRGSTIYQASTANLIADPENEHPACRITSGEGTAYSSARVEGIGTNTDSERTHVDSEIRRRNGSAKSTTGGDDASSAKAARRPWIVRILHKLWFEVIGGFFRRMFRGRRSE